jgi:hypothetical protein
MDQFTHKRETRRQTALDRLGTNEPHCVICGETDWRVLERHHIAGRAYDEFGSIICRNCHRKLSDSQKDHPKKIGEPPCILERTVHFLRGLANFLALLIETLRRFANELAAQI